jgi:hypothetical protein
MLSHQARKFLPASGADACGEPAQAAQPARVRLPAVGTLYDERISAFRADPQAPAGTGHQIRHKTG